MNKKNIIINSIVFLSDLERGVSQEDLLDQVKNLGLTSFEVRREFLKNILVDLKAIRHKAEQLGISLYYSINEDLLVNGELNAQLEVFFEEAKLLQAPFIKLNIGDASNTTANALAPLSAYPLQLIGLRVENNQTEGHANLANCLQILKLAKEKQLPLSFVFDTGNWAWVKESANEAAKLLEAETTYLHCKNYLLKDGLPEVSQSLFEGELDIRQLQAQFHHLDSLALEYPTTVEQLTKDIAILEKEW